MDKVVNIDSYRDDPHYTVHTLDDGVHIIPEQLIYDVIDGVKDPSILTNSVLRRIIDEWADLLP